MGWKIPPMTVRDGGLTRLPWRKGIESERSVIRARTPSSNAKIFPEYTPISVLHLTEWLIRPMPLVEAILSSTPSFHRIRELRFDSRPAYAVVIIHPGNAPATEHDLSNSLTWDYWGGGHVCGSIILCVPIKDKLSVVHLANFPFLFVHSKVTRADRVEICVGHWGEICSRFRVGWRGRGGRHGVGCRRL